MRDIPSTINLTTKGCDCIACRLWPFVADGHRKVGDGNVANTAQGLAILAGRLVRNAPEHMRGMVFDLVQEALRHGAQCDHDHGVH